MKNLKPHQLIYLLLVTSLSVRALPGKPRTATSLQRATEKRDTDGLSMRSEAETSNLIDRSVVHDINGQQAEARDKIEPRVPVAGDVQIEDKIEPREDSDQIDDSTEEIDKVFKDLPKESDTPERRRKIKRLLEREIVARAELEWQAREEHNVKVRRENLRRLYAPDSEFQEYRNVIPTSAYNTDDGSFNRAIPNDSDEKSKDSTTGKRDFEEGKARIEARLRELGYVSDGEELYDADGSHGKLKEKREEPQSPNPAQGLSRRNVDPHIGCPSLRLMNVGSTIFFNPDSFKARMAEFRNSCFKCGCKADLNGWFMVDRESYGCTKHLVTNCLIAGCMCIGDQNEQKLTIPKPTWHAADTEKGPGYLSYEYYDPLKGNTYGDRNSANSEVYESPLGYNDLVKKEVQDGELAKREVDGEDLNKRSHGGRRTYGQGGGSPSMQSAEMLKSQEPEYYGEASTSMPSPSTTPCTKNKPPAYDTPSPAPAYAVEQENYHMNTPVISTPAPEYTQPPQYEAEQPTSRPSSSPCTSKAIPNMPTMVTSSRPCTSKMPPVASSTTCTSKALATPKKKKPCTSKKHRVHSMTKRPCKSKTSQMPSSKKPCTSETSSPAPQPTMETPPMYTSEVYTPPVESTPTMYVPPVESTPSIYVPPVESTSMMYESPVESTPTMYEPPVESTPSMYVPAVESTPSMYMPPEPESTLVYDTPVPYMPSPSPTSAGTPVMYESEVPSPEPTTEMPYSMPTVRSY